MATITPAPITGAFRLPSFTASVGAQLVPLPVDAGVEIIGSVYEGGPMATKTVNFTLAVTASPDWFLSIAPTSLTVAQGAVAVFNVTATAQGGFTGSISLSILGLPVGVSATISPNPIAQTGTAVVSIPTANIPVGTLNLTLQGVTA